VTVGPALQERTETALARLVQGGASASTAAEQQPSLSRPEDTLRTTSNHPRWPKGRSRRRKRDPRTGILLVTEFPGQKIGSHIQNLPAEWSGQWHTDSAARPLFYRVRERGAAAILYSRRIMPRLEYAIQKYEGATLGHDVGGGAISSLGSRGNHDRRQHFQSKPLLLMAAPSIPIRDLSITTASFFEPGNGQRGQ